MRSRTLAIRILHQMKNDRRTLALILVAPVIVLTLVYFILKDPEVEYKIVVSHSWKSMVLELKGNKDIHIKVREAEKNLSGKELKTIVKNREAIAAVSLSNDFSKVKLYIDGSNAGDAVKIESAVKKALVNAGIEKQKKQIRNLASSLQQLPPVVIEKIDVSFLATKLPKVKVDYVYGSKNNSFFDNYGTSLIGIIVFFFVFLIAGINFLTERKTGTLEKMLSMPIKRREIVSGYMLGFSVLALIQTAIITVFVIYALGLHVEGSIWYVFLVSLLMAITALSLGILLSNLANSEFQMVQFIPLVIIPQIFLCGLFQLSSGWQVVSKFIPLQYTTHALTEIVIRGSGIKEVWLDLLILLAFSIVFIQGNVFLLRKQRPV